MAGYIKKNVKKGLIIAVISKNCAEFIIGEIAIWWMVDCVTVALFPNLNKSTTKFIFKHSDPKMAFIGKLEEPCWQEMKGAIPSKLDCVKFPLSPESCDKKKWEEILKSSEPICKSVENAPTSAEELEAIIVYTLSLIHI